MRFFFKKKRRSTDYINPDEIFLDSSNLPEFDTNQFEGRFEKPISRSVALLTFGVFAISALLFVGKIWELQVVDGKEYLQQSENNRLRKTLIFSKRGIIYDRGGVELAWNISPEVDEKDEFSLRQYIDDKAFTHILGYVGYPQKDRSGIYYETEIKGKDGVESFYNDMLMGKNGIKITETDALSDIKSEAVVSPPKDGDNLNLSIDHRVQSKLYDNIKNLSLDKGFHGGASIIMDIANGEVLALASYPSYDAQVLTDGDDNDLIAKYINDEDNPFLNRVISGLYTPGSIIKPFVAAGALDKGIIDEHKSIYSSGELVVQNPYNPDLSTVFKDWKAHGWVDMREALAVSSNVYFYEIGGGFEGQEGLGILNIEKYSKLFGIGGITGMDALGEVEGVIPNPDWKEEHFPGDPWRIGDTYHTAIGQYGFQVTPVQMVRAVSAIANGGVLISPHLRLDERPSDVSRIKIDDKNIKIIQEGMRLGVLEGTAKGLNIPSVKVAAKTGTAELGTRKELVNSWVIGFFPYDNPKFAFATVMEKGPVGNTVGALFVIRQLIDWMTVNTPEYVQ